MIPLPEGGAPYIAYGAVYGAVDGTVYSTVLCVWNILSDVSAYGVADQNR